MPFGDVGMDDQIGSGGFCRCHGMLNPRRTAQGGIAKVTALDECIIQRLKYWQSVKKGEKLDPNIGCCLYQFWHARASPENVKEVEAKLLKDMKHVFPEFKDKIAVDVTRIDTHDIEAKIFINTSEFTISANKAELMAISRQAKATREALGLWF